MIITIEEMREEYIRDLAETHTDRRAYHRTVTRAEKAFELERETFEYSDVDLSTIMEDIEYRRSRLIEDINRQVYA